MASIGVQPAPAAQSKGNFLSQDSRLRSVVLSLLLVAITFAVYAPVHRHPFAAIDDASYVSQNPHIKDGPTVGTAFWAFTHGYAGNWHPLTWMSHALDLEIFGTDPAGHHDENVLLHALDAALLFWVLKRATGYTWRSLMVAALFALHPVNVESVAWIAERKTMLSTMFCLLALAAYRWYASKPGIVRYLVMAGLFVLGLMSKPQIIMLPLVLLAWDYWPLQRIIVRGGTPPQNAADVLPAKSFWWLVKEKAPLFFICLVDAGVTLIAQQVAGGTQEWPLWVRIENAIVSYTRYLRKAFVPADLAMYYSHPGRTLHWWQVGGAALVLLLITVWAWRARQHRYLLTGWLWFLIMLIPMIGLVQPADVQGMADRYAYNSFVGLFIMVCWGAADWATEKHWPKALLPASSVVILAALTLLTHQQIGYWGSDLALWSHSAQVTHSWKPEFLWGLALDAQGQSDAAIGHFFRAAKVEKHDPFIDFAIAKYEYTHNHLPLALDYYQKAYADAWNSDQKTAALKIMSAVYLRMGDRVKADECLARIQTLPQKKINWQGAWWQEILPQIKQWLHGGPRPQG